MTDLRITTPCHESWDGMSRRAAGRHCAECDQTVVDLSGLPPEQFAPAVTTIQERLAAGDRVCVRAPANDKGLVQAPLPRRRRRLLLTNGLAGIIAVTLAGCQGAGPDIVPSSSSSSASARASSTTTTTTTTTVPRAAIPRVDIPAPDRDTTASPPQQVMGLACPEPTPSQLPPRCVQGRFVMGEVSATPPVQNVEPPPLPHERL